MASKKKTKKLKKVKMKPVKPLSVTAAGHENWIEI
jgi:hypothetical protein